MQKPCRILYISSTYSRDEKDNQNPWMVDTIRHLKAKGYEIEILAPSFKGLKSHCVGGVQVYRFRYFFAKWEKLTHDQGAPNKIRGSLFYKSLLFPYVFFGMIAAMRVARRGNYDFIHCHWPFPHGLIGYAGTLTAPRKPKLIMHFHGACLLLAAKFKPIAPLIRFCIRNSQGTVSNSGFTSSLVKKVWEAQGSQAKAPHSSLSHQDSHSSRSLEKEVQPLSDFGPQSIIGFGSPLSGEPLPPAQNDIKIILTVGRVVERKGIVYLLRALPKILAEQKAKVVIVGKGDPKVEADLQSEVKKLKLENSVVFAGKVAEAELIDWYRRCDIFCLPAIVDSQGETEGLGVVLLEALNYARPVVASNVGGIPDIIRHEQTGLLCAEKDPDALAKALLRLLKDSHFAEKLGQLGHEMVEKEFSWPHIVKLWEEFYAEVGW